jgi:carbon-monoxide dehydrogenase medium subunit
VHDLHGISEKRDQIVIKAMTTMRDILDSPFLTGGAEILKIAAKNVGTCAIRNMATVGGNLTCRYTWTEMPAIMVALEADLHFMGKDGKEEVLSAEKFFETGAKTDKILTQITIKKGPQSSLAYRRVKRSPHVDIPLLSLLIKTTFDKNKFTKTRVAINNCIDFAKRDLKLEEFLDRSSLSGNVAQEALAHLDESIYDTRASDYKKHMFRVSLQDAITELVGKK